MATDRLTCALVVGGAGCVGEDIKTALALFKPDRVYAANDIGAHLETLHVWCSLHPEFMDQWEAQRSLRGLPGGYEIIAPLTSEVGMHGKKGNVARRVSYRWPGMTSSASSGIYAAKVALDDGCDRVVLAGIPLDVASGHFLSGTPKFSGKKRDEAWLERDSFIPGFEKAIPYLLGRAKSMSGHTKEVLGAPTSEWLAGPGDPDGLMGAMPENAARG